MTTADLAKDWTDAQLEALPRGKTMWNPWAKIWLETKDPRADKLVARWSYIHDGQYTTGYDDPENRDPLDFLHQEATLRQSGVRVVRDPKSNRTAAVFPNVPAQPTRQDEDAWELRAQAMHAGQQTIELEDTPEAEHVPPPQSGERQKEPARFEDLSPEERARWNKLTRGD